MAKHHRPMTRSAELRHGVNHSHHDHISHFTALVSGQVRDQTRHLPLSGAMPDTLPTEPTGPWLVKVAIAYFSAYTGYREYYLFEVCNKIIHLCPRLCCQ